MKRGKYFFQKAASPPSPGCSRESVMIAFNGLFGYELNGTRIRRAGIMEDRPRNKKRIVRERIEGDRIILNGQGHFPKQVVIVQPDRKIEYKLVRSKKGKFLLNV